LYVPLYSVVLGERTRGIYVVRQAEAGRQIALAAHLFRPPAGEVRELQLGAGGELFRAQPGVIDTLVTLASEGQAGLKRWAELWWSPWPPPASYLPPPTSGFHWAGEPRDFPQRVLALMEQVTWNAWDDWFEAWHGRLTSSEIVDALSQPWPVEVGEPPAGDIEGMLELVASTAEYVLGGNDRPPVAFLELPGVEFLLNMALSRVRLALGLAPIHDASARMASRAGEDLARLTAAHLVHNTDSLLSVAVLELYWAVERNMRLTRCPACGAFALVSDLRSQYCGFHTPPPSASEREEAAYRRRRELAISGHGEAPTYTEWRKARRGERRGRPARRR
jgi:hypothetical protein